MNHGSVNFGRELQKSHIGFSACSLSELQSSASPTVLSSSTPWTTVIYSVDDLSNFRLLRLCSLLSMSDAYMRSLCTTTGRDVVVVTLPSFPGSNFYRTSTLVQYTDLLITLQTPPDTPQPPLRPTCVHPPSQYIRLRLR